jgi:oligopeptide/dipeptide ABC transporter ATP-binding protein
MLDNVKTNNSNTLLEFKDVKKHFPIRQGVFAKTKGYIKAVDGISYDIRKAETFGLVGESGCGKSTTSKLVLLIESITSGEILFDGKDITKFNAQERLAYRKAIQPVFQDPTGSLDPRCRVKTIISEPLQVGKNMTKEQIKNRVSEVLDMAGLRSEHAELFPHQFSGGQRQRIAIARALSTEPKLIILDEPISSLDVSIRANMMNRLMELQAKLGLSYMLIAHDLAVILHMSTRVAVMYLGKIVETGTSQELYEHTAHPYTKALFAAAFHSADEDKLILPGEVASPYRPPTGCHFHPRCPNAMDICKKEYPQIKEIAPGHRASCHLFK